MFLLKSIIVLNFMCTGFRFAIANSACSSCPSISVSECLQVLKNVIEDERKIRDSLPEISEKLAQKDCDEDDDTKFTDCAKLQKSGNNKSGVYTIYPKTLSNDKGIKVYCDMETDGGGWTVIQRRAEYPGNQIAFTRSWNEYRNGFGNLSQEFWLGNDNIHVLTNQKAYELRIDLKDFEGNSSYAKYKTMKIGDSASNYILSVGEYSGDAGDALKDHNTRQFYTYDKDTADNCSNKYKGGWWYTGDANCYYSNLNGLYMRGQHSGYVGIVWQKWLGFSYSLKGTEMKIRPRNLQDET